MDYKKALISMIEEMENCDFLFKIYHYAIVKYRRKEVPEMTDIQIFMVDQI